MKKLLMLAIGAAAVGAAVAEKPFVVCSFNMRTDCDKGEHAWTNRLPLILKVMERHRFDIIGAQELKLNQVAHLRGALSPKGSTSSDTSSPTS